jgi:hypothetical protein
MGIKIEKENKLKIKCLAEIIHMPIRKDYRKFFIR